MILLLLLVPLISLVTADYRYSSCRQYENKIYQLTVTFPGKEPFYAALRLQTKGAFNELFSIAGGNNEKELGKSFALSDRIGYYKCLAGDIVQATGLGYLYKTHGIQFLEKNGAVVIHDYYLRFSDYGRRCTGKVKFAVFENGENPFTTKEEPVYKGETGSVKCELLKFHKYFTLFLD